MLQAPLLISLGIYSKKMRSSCGKYVMDVAFYFRLGTIVIGAQKVSTLDPHDFILFASQVREENASIYLPQTSK